MMVHGLRVVVAALLVLVPAAACRDSPTAPEQRRLAIDPPPPYLDHWARVESCSGLTGDFQRVRWFLVGSFPDGEGILGQWNSRHEITLRVDVWLAGDVVQHEILHDLLNGDMRHEDEAWDVCELPRGVE